jgi:small GTP-binding protein
MAELWEYDVLIKIIVVGDSSVGKSCLLLRYAENSFNDTHCATIGVDFKLKTEVINGKTAKIQIWDTAGQERFRSITSSYYRGAHGVLLVYDVTNEKSFENVATWYRDIKASAQDSLSIILVGNKSDLEAKRVVSTARGKELAKEWGIEFFEVSAKDNVNVDNAFHSIAEKVIKSKNYLANTPETGTNIVAPVRRHLPGRRQAAGRRHRAEPGEAGRFPRAPRPLRLPGLLSWRHRAGACRRPRGVRLARHPRRPAGLLRG